MDPIFFFEPIPHHLYCLFLCDLAIPKFGEGRFFDLVFFFSFIERLRPNICDVVRAADSERNQMIKFVIRKIRFFDSIFFCDLELHRLRHISFAVRDLFGVAIPIEIVVVIRTERAWSRLRIRKRIVRTILWQRRSFESGEGGSQSVWGLRKGQLKCETNQTQDSERSYQSIPLYRLLGIKSQIGMLEKLGNGSCA